MSKSEPLPEGTVIMAENQFAGRGQQHNAWQSEPGKNLTFSIYLKPAFLPVSQQFFLNMAISIAINDALSEYIPSGVKIKWPNDVYFHDRKLGGILIENSLVGQTLKSTIIGIGLNVNQLEFPEAIRSRATSLQEILHENVNLIKLLAVICSHIEKQYLKLKTLRPLLLRKGYLERLYKFGENARYKHRGEVFEGAVTGVNEQGMLLIDRDGNEQAYNFKEIEFLP